LHLGLLLLNICHEGAKAQKLFLRDLASLWAWWIQIKFPDFYFSIKILKGLNINSPE
jgi:hypothetical protein